MAKKKAIEKPTPTKSKVIKKKQAAIAFPENNIKESGAIVTVEKKQELVKEETALNEPIVLYEAKPEKVIDNVSKDSVQKFDKLAAAYLQIHKGNIYSIYSSAIIAPAKYIKNRAFQDVQSINEDVLTIANQEIAELDKAQVLLEITLTESDYKHIDIHGDLAILKIPLPISRIKSICVADSNTRKDIITKALTADGGIIPDALFKEDVTRKITSGRATSIKIEHKSIDNSELLRRYDKILGAFAFVKNYSLALANKTESLSVLPKHFFYMAQAVNNAPEYKLEKNDKTVQFYQRLFGIYKNTENSELRWIFERLNETKNFGNQDIEVFGAILLANKQAADFDAKIKGYLKELSDSLKRKSVLNQTIGLPEQIRLYLTLFGFLRTYGSVTSEDRSISRRELPELVDPTFGEYVYSCLGYFYGYTALRNFDERLNVKDPYISEVVSYLGNIGLKFELTTLFDYGIIESVFQTVFYDNPSITDVSFLRSDSIKKDIIRKPKSLPIEYVFDYSIVLDKFNFSIQKKSKIEEALSALVKVIDNIPAASELGVYCWRVGIEKHSFNIFEYFSSLGNLRYFVYFKKTDIVEALKNKIMDATELLKRLEVSNKFQEFK